MTRLRPLILLLCLGLGLAACSRGEQASAPEAAGAHAGAPAEFERGPHRGRLLRDGDFALELQIFEEGVPPEFHVYLFEKDQPLPPDAARVGVELTRLDGEVDRFAFSPEGEFLRGDGVVREPHSFSVVVTAERDGRTHRWAYDSFEGRTRIPDATAGQAGIGVEEAGPATITHTVMLTGRIVPNAERVRQVTARFAGPVRSVLRSVGDVVEAGDVLATVESNESLQVYAVTAPIGGTVVERRTNPGEAAGGEPLFVVADYGTVWAELSMFPRELGRIRAGQVVHVEAVEGDGRSEARILRVAPAGVPGGGAGTGVHVARVQLDNRDGRWAPGQFVRGQVQVGARQVPLAVRRTGLQTFRDFTVVFEKVGETYEVRMLELGEQDDTWVEVKEGLKPGARYVARNSYLIKADIEKSGASHDH